MNHNEDKEQEALFAWAKYFNELRNIFAVPNGAFLAGDATARAKQMNRLKKQGLKTGVSDIFLPVAKNGKHGLFIEMKNASGKGRLSGEQKDFLSEMASAGYACAICHGAGEAIDEIKDYMNLGGK